MMYQTDPPRSPKDVLPWLRWYDWTGCWVLTSTEQERQRAERLIAQLRRHEVACR